MRRSRLSERSESTDRWLVSYADFITLLFAFFTVLYATSERNIEKTEKFEQSVQKYLIKAGAFGGSGEKINQGEKNNTPIEPPIQSYRQGGDEKSVDLQKELEAFVETQLTAERHNGAILDISTDELGVRISFQAERFFQKDQPQLLRSALPLLLKIGKFLKTLNKKVLIEGHAVQHSDDPKASTLNVWELSANRAATLVRYLLKVHGFSQDDVMALARGNSRPFVPSGEADAKIKNSRMDFVLLPEDTPL